MDVVYFFFLLFLKHPSISYDTMLIIVHAYFLIKHLIGPPIKYLGLIDYLINQPNKPNPLKYPKQFPINYLGLLFLKVL